MTRKFLQAFQNPWIAAGVATASGASGMITIFSFAASLPGVNIWSPAAATVLLNLVLAAVCLRLGKQNRGLRATHQDIHQINHTYRDCLAGNFLLSASAGRPTTDQNQRLGSEHEALGEVCGRIAMAFTRMIGADCVATVKLMTMESEQQFCTTYVRSEAASVRDVDRSVRYSIGQGRNTAFQTALALLPDRPSHFHSGDLIKLSRAGRYHNERENWREFYRSTIVVPIRWVRDRERSVIDELGYLCVDTMATNRLNNTDHIQLLAGLADQMYNFINIMRKKYSALVAKSTHGQSLGEQPERS